MGTVRSPALSRMNRLAAALLLLAAGCRTTGLKDGVYRKPGVRYALATPPAGWRQVSLDENDLAWVPSDASAYSLAVDSTCAADEDAPLEILTNHLLMGFTDKWLKQRDLKPIDGRDALVSRYDAKLDGVEVELEVAVLKKNDCVYDFSYVAPKGHFEEGEVAFDKLLGSFTTGTPGMAER